MTRIRLILAVVTTSLEEVAIVLAWRWLLPEFGINLPVSVLIAVMAAWALFGSGLFILGTRALQKKALVGLPGMVGSRGKVASPLVLGGFVKIKGELWGAESAESNLQKGDEVEVVGERGLTLVVRKVGSDPSKR